MAVSNKQATNTTNVARIAHFLETGPFVKEAILNLDFQIIETFYENDKI